MTVRVRLSVPGSGLSLADARIALYSWLYARHEGGVLVLCLEEAAPRNLPPSLCDDLRWLGLDWDEGPISFHTSEPVDPILAAVVSDHALGITHVIRPHEAHHELADYLHLCTTRGWPLPQFTHLAALAHDGPSAWPSSVQACREEGYLPLAVANDLARMGWTPRGKRELLSLEELAAQFDLSRLARRPVKPVPGQLDWFNHRCLAGLDPAQRAGLFAEWWQCAYGFADRAEGTVLGPAAWQDTLADAVAGEVHALAKVPGLVRFAFADDVEPDAQAAEALARPYAGQVLEAFVEGLSAVESFAYDELDAMISALRLHFREVLGVRSRDVLHVVRAALTGRTDGPCVVVACQLLGRARCVQRAQQGISV